MFSPCAPPRVSYSLFGNPVEQNPKRLKVGLFSSDEHFFHHQTIRSRFVWPTRLSESHTCVLKNCFPSDLISITHARVFNQGLTKRIFLKIYPIKTCLYCAPPVSLSGAQSKRGRFCRPGRGGVHNCIPQKFPEIFQWKYFRKFPENLEAHPPFALKCKEKSTFFWAKKKCPNNYALFRLLVLPNFISLFMKWSHTLHFPLTVAK